MIYLKNIELYNFRSYIQKNIKFSPKINIIVGENGIGKTNILEAIYVFSSGISHKTKNLKELIQKNSNDYLIKETISINKKIITKTKTSNEKETPFLKTVIFSPENTDLINGEPEKRRSYIDSVISQYDKQHAKTINNLNKIVKQRAKIIKNNQNAEELLLWNERYARCSENISRKRQNLILKINQEASKIYKAISKREEEINYKFITKPSDISANSIQKELENNLQKEQILGYTDIGAKSDDLIISLNKKKMKGNSSYGEQWSALLAFVISIYNILQKNNEDYSFAPPTLLLDDAFSGLDKKRRKQLTKIVESLGQVIITCADKSEIPANFSYNEILLEKEDAEK